MLKIFIDESGSFATAEHQGSWSLTSAIVLPAPDKRKCIEALKELKIENKFRHNDEVKLKNVSEDSYLSFLHKLGNTNCTLYSVATDAGTQTVEDIEAHRDRQADKIEEHKDKMQHEEMTKQLENQANQVRKLAPQLYLQLICQTTLMSDVVRKSILFYVQRCPKQINAFQWKIDKKTAGRISKYEQSFRSLVLPFLQSESLRNPDVHVTDFDYSAMNDFFYTEDNKPQYLEKDYGIKTSPEGGLNIGKIVLNDFEFVDSKIEEGIQIIDLLVSGIRRTLRGDWETKSQVISEALGSLMVQAIDNKFPIHFITTSEEQQSLSPNAIKASKAFKDHQKPMLT
ncbi:DUF3800 domain-containing protein [Thiomicrorhabdus heinhorstiae]|uniref:DUF3800 domain-containing protein n=1 Tax=Thiomicrorhabdus heinhorstiae TaxID=2748010 RepID=A0ABS0BTA8_9GAMM|nr:DUF3800 domain-containing protein [Thiomicrorhabdus heinhorstiae]MBF6057010.1 DUF3800 domain-containing protein [Thiomicrorhabdus heinhorstiae]